jgi:hypothetical protein
MNATLTVPDTLLVKVPSYFIDNIKSALVNIGWAQSTVLSPAELILCWTAWEMGSDPRSCARVICYVRAVSKLEKALKKHIPSRPAVRV